jgi:cob(I)alamin adenosyltransferase
LKIYTKAGDAGQTGLVDGSRVGKDALRVAAYGDVDELGAVLGLVIAQADDAELQDLLRQVQRDLFAIGAQLADPQARVAARKSKAALTPAHVERLEDAIDRREAELPALRAFILAGGTVVGAHLHLARTVCRRAERSSVALHHLEGLEPLLLVYLNRLSDLLFVLARHVNQRGGRPEDLW